MQTVNEKRKTTFSPSVRNFLIGMGSVLNLAGNYYSRKYSSLGEKRDVSIIATAWKTVGEEFERAMRKFLEENPPLASK